MAAYIAKAAAADDPLMLAVIGKASGRAEAGPTLMRVTPEHGVVEIGNIYWGLAMARSRVATEALYLHAAGVFDTSTIAASNGSATISTNPAKPRLCASASCLKASSAST